MTFNQVKARGGSVLKDEHGSVVVKYGTFKKAVLNVNGAEEELNAFYLKGYKVFNALQIKGIDFPAVPSLVQAGADERIAKAESIVSAMPSPPQIREGVRTVACYRRLDDSIEMPSRASFDSLEDFYTTLFHELVHSSGHESRLNRKSLIENDGFGGKVYSEEELVAEMGAAFLGTEADIVRDDYEQSAAYLKGWLDVFKDKDHRRWIVRSANQAGKAADFILGRIADDSSSSPESEENTGQVALPTAA